MPEEQPIIIQLMDTGQTVQFPAGTSKEEIDEIVNRDFAPVMQRRPKLIPPDWNDEEEKEFKSWYDIWAEETGTHPDPDHPEQLYNFREAFRNEAVPEEVPGQKGEYLWPEDYKVDLKRVDPATMRVPEASALRIGYQMYSTAMQVGVGGKLQQLRLYQLNRNIPSEVEQGTGMQVPPSIKKTQYLRDYATEYQEKYGKDPSPDDLRKAITQYEEIDRIKRIADLTDVIEELPKPLPGSSGFIEEALAGLSSFAVDMGITAANPAMGAISTLMTLTGTNGQKYLDQGMDPETAMDRGTLVGLMQLGPEYAGNLLQLRGLAGTLKPFTNKVMKTPVGKRVANVLESWFLTGVTEGFEEYPQQVTEDVMDILFKHMDTNDREGFLADLKKQFPEIAERANYAFKLGTAGGLILGGTGTTVRLPSIVKDIRSTSQQWQFLNYNADRLGEKLSKDEIKEIDESGNTIFGKAQKFVEVMEGKGVSTSDILAWKAPVKLVEKEIKKAEKRVKKIAKKEAVKFTKEEEEQIQKEAEEELKKPGKEAPVQEAPTGIEALKKERETSLANSGALREAGDLLNAAKEIQKAHKLRTQIEKEEKVEQKPEEQVQEKVMLSLAEKKPQEVSKGLDKKLVKEISQTKNFINWFKKSKTVDKEGVPVQFFHGTTAAFTSFKEGDVGFHVGTAEQANSRVIPPWMEQYIAAGVLPAKREGLNIMPVFIKTEKPLRLRDIGNWDNSYQLAQDVFFDYDGKIVTEKDYDHVKKLNRKGEWSKALDFVKKKIMDAGYDSIVYTNTYESKETAQDSYILFDPEQIKSVYNAGSFDTATPVISLSAKEKSALEKARKKAIEQAKKGTKQALPYDKLERQLLEQRLTQAQQTVAQTLESSVRIPKALKERMGLRVKEEIKLSDLLASPESIAAHVQRGININDAVVLGYASTNPEFAAITLALADISTMQEQAFHEYYHIAETFLLTPEDQKLIKELIPNQEERAIAFGKYMTKKIKGKPQQRTIWDKIINFLKELKEAFLANGVKTTEDVFGKIEKGAYKPKIGVKETMEEIREPAKTLDHEVAKVTQERLNKITPPKEARETVKRMSDTWLSLEDGDEIRSRYQDETPAMVNLPELVQLIKEINDGQVPQVVKQFRKRGVQGLFIPGKGVIKLHAGIFKDTKLAESVLAHEIGHLVDWLPDKTLARGNILGRIASLRNHMATVLPRYKGAPGELTEEDRRRFRLEAERIMKVAAGTRTKVIDEMIEKELGITPKEVLDIWNALVDARILNPDLYDFIAAADAKTKKLIIKEALKGRVASELKQFTKTIKVPTGKKITITEEVKIRKKDIEKKYADLVNKEIKKRRLWIADEISDELKKLTRIWRPFNPAANPAYTKYRYSSKELYADAISVLFSSPDLMRTHAPKFYEAFFLYMDEKPRVKKVYDDIQNRIRAGNTLADLTERTYQMFDGGNQKLEEMFNKKDAKWRDRFARDFIDVFHFVIKDVKHMNESSIPAHENPRYALEEMVYSGSEVEELLENVLNNVIKPLEKANLKWDKEFGLLGFLERISVERAEMANPLGWDAARALEKIKEMQDTKLSRAQWRALKKALKNFRKIHQENFIDKAENLNIFDPKLIELFRDREKYLTFNVQKYLFDRYGQPAGLKIYEQIGTFQEVVNPATATLLRDISFIKAANKNKAVKTTIEFYLKPETQETLGIKVKPAKKIWDANLKKRVYKRSENAEEELMVYLEGGKAKGYYVDKYIAEAFDNNPFHANAATDVLKFIAHPFRRLYTDLNYGFWMFNMYRDYKRAVNALPGASYLNFMPEYLKAFKPAFRSVFGIPDSVASEIRKQNMLISVAEIRGLTPQDKTIERMLRMYSLRPDEWNKKMVTPFGHLFNWVANNMRKSEFYVSSLGRGFERTTKIAGYQFMKKKFPDMPKEALGHIVRTRAGSPDFLRVGRLHPIYNNLLLFSNAMKEGYRGDWESVNDPQNRFWYKKAKYLFIPKALMWMAKIGMMDQVAGMLKDPGDDEERKYDYPVARIMAGVSEYDLTNYTIIPIGLTSTGKSVYFRIPHDETSRLLGGWFWKAINHEDLGYANMAQSIFEYGADQLPGWNPGFKFLGAIKTMLSGRNYYDEFYDRNAVPETEFEAGGERAWTAFGKYLFGQLGVLSFYKFKRDGLDEVIGEMEDVLGFPLNTPVPEWMVKIPGQPGLHNALGRFIKVSDYGVREKVQRKLKMRVRRENARAILDAKEVTYKILKGEVPEPGDLMRMALKPDVVDRAALIALARKYGYVYLDMYESAATTDEKMFILGEMLKANGLPENVFEVSMTEKARKAIVEAEKLIKKE